MIDFNSCTEKELWEHVAVALSKNGLKNVLVGGAVAAIYSKGLYKSGDLDFVIESYGYKKNVLDETMNEIGFKKVNRHWVHPDCKHLYVEFCNPPVAIGDDYKIEPIRKVENGVEVAILTPTDCVRDRLAGYLYWGARECLDQAILVAQESEVEIKKIKSWCKSEGKKGVLVFEEFESRLTSRSS